MISVSDQYLQEDLSLLSNNEKIRWESFSGKTVLITGASGLIGSLVIKAIIYACEQKCIPVTVIGMLRDSNKATAIYRDFMQSLSTTSLFFVEGDIVNPIKQNHKIDFIIHAASPTGSKFFVTKPVETIQSIVLGTDHLLQLAVKHHIESMVYISSMEVFGSVESTLPVVEQDLGVIDLHAVRSSYPEGKRMAECLCAAYAKEYGVPVRIARLAQTFGAGVLPSDTRIFAQFARSLMNRENIVLHTRGLSEGNYCYSRDVITAILMLLFLGASGEAYTVVNEDSHITIAGMAEMVAHDIAEDRIRVVYDIPADNSVYGYAPDVKLHLSGQKMRSLGWQPEVSLEESFYRMIGSLKEQEALG